LPASKFVDTALAIVRDHYLSPARLELELTEFGVIRDLVRAQEVMQALPTASFALTIHDLAGR